MILNTASLNNAPNVMEDLTIFEFGVKLNDEFPIKFYLKSAKWMGSKQTQNQLSWLASPSLN